MQHGKYADVAFPGWFAWRRLSKLALTIVLCMYAAWEMRRCVFSWMVRVVAFIQSAADDSLMYVCLPLLQGWLAIDSAGHLQHGKYADVAFPGWFE